METSVPLDTCSQPIITNGQGEHRDDRQRTKRFTITLTKVSRHGRARPGHPRLACGTIDVDARNKSGHDGEGFGSTISENALRRPLTAGVFMDRAIWMERHNGRQGYGLERLVFANG